MDIVLEAMTLECNYPGCTVRVYKGIDYCDTHTEEMIRQRSSGVRQSDVARMAKVAGKLLKGYFH